MRTRLSLLVIAAGFVAVTAASAEVNCKQVSKYLQTGRTPQDVADTMVIPIDDVKKCQQAESASGAAAPQGGATGGTAPAKAAAPDAPKK